jgi:fumarate reductase subunit C
MTLPGAEPLTYRRPISTWWWLSKRTYFVFVMRELSSIFIAWFVVFLLLLLRAVTLGAAEYDDFLDWAASPWVVVLNLVAAAFLVLHVVAIIGGQYAGLAVVSALVVWLVTR